MRFGIEKERERWEGRWGRRERGRERRTVREGGGERERERESSTRCARDEVGRGGRLWSQHSDGLIAEQRS